jgi:small subunit ribosomal protein S16
MVEPNEIALDMEKIEKWLEKGAEPSNTVRSLLKKAGK